MNDVSDLARRVQADLPNKWTRSFDNYVWAIPASLGVTPLAVDLVLFLQGRATMFGWVWSVGIATIAMVSFTILSMRCVSPGVLRARAERLADLDKPLRGNTRLFRGEVVGAADFRTPVITKDASDEQLRIASQPFAISVGDEVIVVDTEHIDVFMGMPTEERYFRTGEKRLIVHVGASVALIASGMREGRAPDWLSRVVTETGYRDGTRIVSYVVASEDEPALLRIFPMDLRDAHRD